MTAQFLRPEALTRGHAPDPVSGIVRNQECALPLNDHADRPALCLALGIEKAGQDIDRLCTRRKPAFIEGDIDNLVP